MGGRELAIPSGGFQQPWRQLNAEDVRIEGMAVEDGPLLGAHSALRAFALHLKWCVPAITPDVGDLRWPAVLRQRSSERTLFANVGVVRNG